MKLLGKIRQDLEESYFTRKASRKVLKDRQEGRTFVYVHTMGKVGSSTLRTSLRSSAVATRLAVYGTYFLSEDGLKFFRHLEQDGFGDWNRFIKPVKYLLCEGEVLSHEIRRAAKNGERVKVITLVRDPVATNVSGFFQNYYWWPKKIINQCKAHDPDCVQDLIEIYFERYPHDVPLTWWNEELKDVFHVDVMSHAFPQAQGYEIYHSDMADALVLKLERLDRYVEDALKEFMAMDEFRIITANAASNKWYSAIYRLFCDSIVFPDNYLTQLYQSPLYRNFYSQEELSSFERTWRR